MIERRPIMVMAGGTGGHVFPALAVANHLRDQGEQIIWMGTRAGIEARLVPEAGFPIEWLKVQGLRGKGLLTKALAPLKLLQACWQALSILRQHKPRAVLGMGGFVAGPGGVMARMLRIPVIIHEQNAVMGLTNRWLSRIASACFFAFPEAAKGVRNSQVVGNPVRREILAIEAPELRLQQRGVKPLRILVIGGSLGAKTLNEVVPRALQDMAIHQKVEILHQCGERHLAKTQELYKQCGVDAEVKAFINNMTDAYQWADLVICRAGALTVAELSAAGVASILVPFPFAVDDHQYLNASFLQRAGAALLVRDQAFSAEWLRQQILDLNNHREHLIEMACQARSVAYTDATEQVANGVLREALV
ncbi:MAG: undecaprenyldiphospho-muramoylpentapeptide beta-N-acetylglucosaminyltransferase [Gammaproteobacteria bacterium]|nr:undecaprenyldiphospho-muramoylpentapeptide beta-N-acetylglucosaminyltransferase [Gammaproteobacteria bacterium]